MISNEDLDKEIRSLVLDCGRDLRHYLRGGRFLLPEDLVAEVINDALLVIALKRRCGTTLTNPRGYLFAAARNAAKDRLKNLYAEVPDSPALESRSAPDCIDMLAGVLVREDLRDAIRQLPSRQRQVIELRYLREFTIAETAEILGMAEGTVGPTTAGALRNLKRIITERGGAWEEETR
jgi:RNA polymerase sigma factor (sigma-70 family)